MRHLMGRHPLFEDYRKIIEYSEEDQCYIFSMPELPGCSSHGETYQEALCQGRQAFDAWVAMAIELNITIPISNLQS